MSFIVKPITRLQAKMYCEKHPHAPSLPNSSKYYMALYINNSFRGLAVWGYGIQPRQLPITLFGKNGNISDYLELCRYFVDNDNVPEHTASKFLAITHRLIKKHTKVKYLFTYAAGFQGLLGTIYKASGYDYIGKYECRTYYIKGKGLIHPMSLYHRYHVNTHMANKQGLELLEKIFNINPYVWCGYNFKYIYWLCSKQEKDFLMQSARFKIEPLPTKNDIEIWLEDKEGKVERIKDLLFAKKVPIIKLKTKRHACIA